MAWCCAAKLEMAAGVTASVVSGQMQAGGEPARGGTPHKLQAAMGSRMGLGISVAAMP